MTGEPFLIGFGLGVYLMTDNKDDDTSGHD